MSIRKLPNMCCCPNDLNPATWLQQLFRLLAINQQKHQIQQGKNEMNNQTAIEIKRAIKPILDTMNKAMTQDGGLTLKVYQSLFKVTFASLDEIISQADKAIAAAEYAHKQRPVDLINKAGLRQGIIPSEIEREQALSNSLTQV